MINIPRTTLFMLESLDGKISTGNINERDLDKDFTRIKGIKEGLFQYYDLEKRTDIYSMNTGKVMEKIGVNTRKGEPKKTICSFIIIDNKPHINAQGIIYLTKWVKKLILVTTNKNHPAFKQKIENLEIIYCDKKIDFPKLFVKLKKEYKVNRLTIQSGATMNATLLRNKLIDRVSIVIAPALIGGEKTRTLVDGDSLKSEKDLEFIKSLTLIKCTKLKNSYLHLVYKVNNETKVDKLKFNNPLDYVHG